MNSLDLIESLVVDPLQAKFLHQKQQLEAEAEAARRMRKGKMEF